MISTSDKNVSSVTKSKLDWDEYTKKQKLEKELESNRKDGSLAKKRFLETVASKEHAQFKEVERLHEKTKLKAKPKWSVYFN